MQRSDWVERVMSWDDMVWIGEMPEGRHSFNFASRTISLSPTRSASNILEDHAPGNLLPMPKEEL